MDAANLVKLIKETFDRKKRGSAEKELDEIMKKAGALPCLLQIIKNVKNSMAVRKGAVIHLDKWISSSWSTAAMQDCYLDPADIPPRIDISDPDRDQVKELLVPAIAEVPSVIQAQLLSILKEIAKHDFRHRWPTLCVFIIDFLRSPHPMHWPGGLRIILALVETYDEFGPIEKSALVEELSDILPFLQSIMAHNRIVHKPFPAPALEVHFLFLKLIHTGFVKGVPLALFGSEGDEWKDFHFVIASIENVLRKSYSQLDKKSKNIRIYAEAQKNEWWTVNKWIFLVLNALVVPPDGAVVPSPPEEILFRRYICQNQFKPSIDLTVKILEGHYITGKSIGDPVLRQALVLLKVSILNDRTWKYVQPHAENILNHVIFPLFNLSDADHRLLERNPKEFVTSRYEHRHNGSGVIPCAEQLLRTLGTKNLRHTIRVCMPYVTFILSSSIFPFEKKVGAMHVLGVIAPGIVSLNEIKEEFVIRCILSNLTPTSPYFVRMGTCWLLETLSRFPFQEKLFLHISHKLLPILDPSCKDPPYVKAAAAFAFQQYVRDHAPIFASIKDKMVKIVFDLLTIIDDTNDMFEVGPTLGTICVHFTDQLLVSIGPIFERIAEIFAKIIEYQPNEKCESVGLGLLTTMTMILRLVDKHDRSLTESLEKSAVRVCHLVLVKRAGDFYKQVFSILHLLTKRGISKPLWGEVELLYCAIEEGDNQTLVQAMLPVYNFITVDTDTFLEEPTKCLRLIEVVEHVVAKTIEEEEEDKMCVYIFLNALKILEVLVLQCGHKVKEFFILAVKLALELLSYSFEKHPELDAACAQVVLASMYMDNEWLFTQKLADPVRDFVNNKVYKIDQIEEAHEMSVFILGLSAIVERSLTPEGANDVDPNVVKKMLSKLVKLLIELEEEVDVNNEVEAEEHVGIKPVTTIHYIYPTTLELHRCLDQEYSVVQATIQCLQAENPLWYEKIFFSLPTAEQEKIEQILKFDQDSSKLPPPPRSRTVDEDPNALVLLDTRTRMDKLHL